MVRRTLTRCSESVTAHEVFTATRLWTHRGMALVIAQRVDGADEQGRLGEDAVGGVLLLVVVVVVLGAGVDFFEAGGEVGGFAGEEEQGVDLEADFGGEEEEGGLLGWSCWALGRHSGEGVEAEEVWFCGCLGVVG